LKYTFRFREKFDEPDDDWLKCIEATSDELLEYTPRPKIILCSQLLGVGARKD
jgi:hypothetical protein